jgi:FG-GAP-like repeat/FG-GAP repeat
VAVEDFNGDGKQDIAVGDTVAGITLLLGDGTGNFTTAPASPFLMRFAIRSMAVGDFDGDGKPDLAVADTSNGVTVLLGDETGNFRTPTGTGWFTVGAVDPTLPLSMTAGDFNGDGRPDLAIPVNSGSNLSALMGNPVYYSVRPEHDRHCDNRLRHAGSSYPDRLRCGTGLQYACWRGDVL